MKRIQFGAGGNRLDGWENHDSDIDITKKLPFSDNHADMVFAEHVVEHVNGSQAFLFMEEVRRILKPGGVFRMCVPVLARLDKAHARDIIINHGHQMVYNLQNAVDMLLIAGFSTVTEVVFDRAIDSHWKVIGEDKDHKETLRLHAIK